MVSSRQSVSAAEFSIAPGNWTVDYFSRERNLAAESERRAHAHLPHTKAKFRGAEAPNQASDKVK